MKKIFFVALYVFISIIVSFGLSFFGNGTNPSVYILDYDRLLLSTKAYNELNKSYQDEFSNIRKGIEENKNKEDYNAKLYQEKIDNLNKISNEKLSKIKDIIDKETEIFIRTSEYKDGIIILKVNIYYYDKTIDITEQVIEFLKEKDI